MITHRIDRQVILTLVLCSWIGSASNIPAFAETAFSTIPKELSQKCKNNFSEPDTVPALSLIESRQVSSEEDVWDLLVETYLSLLEEGTPQREARDFTACIILQTAEMLPASETTRQQIRSLVENAQGKQVPEDLALLNMDILDDVRKVYSAEESSKPEILDQDEQPQQENLQRARKEPYSSEVSMQEKQLGRLDSPREPQPAAPLRTHKKLCSETLDTMQREELSRLGHEVSQLEEKALSNSTSPREMKRDIFRLRLSANRIINSTESGCGKAVHSQAQGLIARLDRVPIAGVRGSSKVRALPSVVPQQKETKEKSGPSFFKRLGNLFSGSGKDEKAEPKPANLEKPAPEEKASAPPAYLPEPPRQAPRKEIAPSSGEYSTDLFDPTPRY